MVVKHKKTLNFVQNACRHFSLDLVSLLFYWLDSREREQEAEINEPQMENF